MGKIVRYITEDGSAFILAADTTDIAARAEQIHHTSAVTTAALGRLLTAASMMGDMLKGADDSVTLRLNCLNLWTKAKLKCVLRWSFPIWTRTVNGRWLMKST